MMTTPYEITKTLSATMRAHVEYGIGGATLQTLDALERRGLTQATKIKGQDSPSVFYVKLNPMGQCVRTLLQGCDPAKLTDQDRADMRSLSDGTVLGPAEWSPCDQHPGHGMIFRWTWDVPEDGDHLAALLGSDPEILAGCPLCEAENDDGEL